LVDKIRRQAVAFGETVIQHGAKIMWLVKIGGKVLAVVDFLLAEFAVEFEQSTRIGVANPTIEPSDLFFNK
jgi:uncharacterized membrane protein